MSEKNMEIETKRQAFTDAFCMEHEIRRRLEAVEDETEFEVESTPEEDAAARAECARHIHPFTEEIAEGEVRVLSGTEHLTYVMVLQKVNAFSWLVVPFSDYSSPATEDELKMLVDGGLGTRVAQLWNARTLTTPTLAKSWLVKTLPEYVQQDVLSAWQCAVGAEEWSNDQRARTGWPIQRRDDVRIAYQQNELKNFATIDAADLKLAEKLAFEENAKAVLERVKDGMRNALEKLRRPFVPAPACQPNYAMAAAPRTEPLVADCPVEGFDGCVHVRYLPETRHLHLQVFGADGDRSTDLDGWALLDGSGELLGVVQDGDLGMVMAENFDGRLALLDDAGNLHELIGNEGK